MKPDYDTTIARIAGNILSGMVGSHDFHEEDDADRMVFVAVELARRVTAEVKRTSTSRPQDEPAP